MRVEGGGGPTPEAEPPVDQTDTVYGAELEQPPPKKTTMEDESAAAQSISEIEAEMDEAQ